MRVRLARRRWTVEISAVDGTLLSARFYWTEWAARVYANAVGSPLYDVQIGRTNSPRRVLVSRAVDPVALVADLNRRMS